LQGPSDAGWIESADGLIGDGGASLGLAWLLVVLTTTWLTDVFAYLYGRTWGKTKLLPHVSPGKTREGALAGLVAGTLTGGLAGYLFGVPVPLAAMFIVGAIIAVGAMVGDLCESMIKRQIGIKDMGAIVPGHGGLLDRIDALLVTIPLTFYLAQLLGWLGWPG
ncbi:MAG: CDP-archaeol synthase, partial [Chloroflexia bacterium]|nr:CDP-archaeol synthase [Chloroflexia bacterium]